MYRVYRVSVWALAHRFSISKWAFPEGPLDTLGVYANQRPLGVLFVITRPSEGFQKHFEELPSRDCKVMRRAFQDFMRLF